MIGRIAPLLLAVAAISAVASAQPPQESRGTPQASPLHTDSVVTLTETDRDGASDRDGGTRIYRLRTDGGTFVIHGKDGTIYRLDRKNGEPLVLKTNGDTYRVDRGDGGAIVLRAKDGRTFRVQDQDHVMVLRAKDGGTYRVESPARAFTIRGGDGRGVELSSVEACDAARPIVDHSTVDEHDRTKIILCDHGAAAAGDRSAQLEQVLERVQNMEGLSDSSRERVVTALREAIEQLRSGHQ
jgi:hypothetical protein